MTFNLLLVVENIYTKTYLQKYLLDDSKLGTSEKRFTIEIFGNEFKILSLSRIIIFVLMVNVSQNF